MGKEMGRLRRRRTPSLQMGSKKSIRGKLNLRPKQMLIIFKSDEQETQKTSPLKAILKQQMAEKAAVQAGTGTKEEVSAKEEPSTDANPEANKSSEQSSAVQRMLILSMLFPF
jgi:hypothetical protein